MALTEGEKTIAKQLKEQGYSTEQIISHIGAKRLNHQSSIDKERFDAFQKKEESLFKRIVSDVPSDYLEMGSEMGNQFSQAGTNIVDIARGEGTPTEKTLDIGSEAYRRGGRVISQPYLFALKAPFTDEFEKKAGGKMQEIGEAAAQTAPVQTLIKAYQDASPETQQGINRALGFAEGAAEIFGLGRGTQGFKKGIRRTIEQGKDTLSSIELPRFSVPKVGDPMSLFRKTPTSVDDAIRQADEALKQNVTANAEANVTVNVPETNIDIDSINSRLDKLIEKGKLAEARDLAEATAPQLSLSEKFAGLRPDIKARIQGKPELMREYIDVVNTRNVNDTAPSVYEHGGDYARLASEEMNKLINKSGSRIGATRQKYGTMQASIDAVQRVENTFDNQLDRLNLELNNGVIRQKPGTVTKTSSGDIKTLTELYNDLKTVKESPTLTNIIDLRSAFDAKINFGKRAAEVSNEIDPLSRQVRKELADVAAGVVGKTEAAELKRFSEFMDAYADLTSYTDRRAGGEYLLRLVLSGRGGEARQITQTIKDYTGIDLIDHATMMQVTNEMLGNEAQKNLFRQEMTKAGFDVAALLGGDPRGAAATLFQKGIDRILDPEKILIDASQ